jgi:hypothetical protein
MTELLTLQNNVMGIKVPGFFPPEMEVYTQTFIKFIGSYIKKLTEFSQKIAQFIPKIDDTTQSLVKEQKLIKFFKSKVKNIIKIFP